MKPEKSEKVKRIKKKKKAKNKNSEIREEERKNVLKKEKLKIFFLSGQ